MTTASINPFERVEIFHGEATPAAARIYARLDTTAGQPGWKLSGHIKGPYRADAHTLPATISLQPCPTGETLLAAAVIPDPCPWTPETPSLYQLDLQLCAQQNVIDRRRWVTGIRGLGARGPHLYRHGKRWVMRAVESPTVKVTNWPVWKSTAAAMAVEPRTEELVSTSSRLGVPLIVKLPKSLDQMESLLYDVAHWPSVTVVYVESGAPMISDPRRRFPNLLFAKRFRMNQPVILSDWTQVVLYDMHTPDQFARAVAGCREELPVVAVREIADKADLEEARSECDRLQRDLAGTLDCAGYLVAKRG